MRRLLLTAAILVSGPALAEVPSVVTDIAPVESLVARVMGDLGQPQLLLRPGASPHDYALRPSEARALQQADLIFWAGPALTPWLEKPLSTLGGQAGSVALSRVEGTVRLAFREGPLFDEQEDTAPSTGDAEDPHAWLDPQNAIVWTGAIADALSQADPGNAATYRANAAAAVADLRALSERVRDRLAGVRPGSFIVFHDAFRYFESRFGVPAAGAITPGDGREPSPARMASLRDAVADSGIACVFAEPQFNPGLIDSVFADTSVATAELDPLGAELEPGPALYPALIETLADRLADCAGR